MTAFPKSAPVLSASPVRASRPSSATVSTLLACATSLEADGLLDAAENAFRAAALSDDAPAAQLALADWLYRTEQHAESIEVYDQLLALAARLEDIELRRVVSHNLAGVLREVGDVARAATIAGISQRDELQKTGQLGACDLTSIALDAAHRGELKLAEELLLRSLAIERSRHSLAGAAADCGNLGAVAAMRGDLSAAIRFLARAYHTHLDVKDSRGAGTDLLNLAEVFRNLGRFRLTARCLRRAEQIFDGCCAGQSAEVARERISEIDRILEVRDRDPLLN